VCSGLSGEEIKVAELKTINLPDVGDFDEIEIIEVLIVPGDEIAAEDSIIVLESDKATMEIPSPYSGTVKSVSVHVGDRISEGTEVAKVEASVPVDSEKPASSQVTDSKSDTETEAAPAAADRIRKISAAHLHRSWVTVPHVTQFDEANITELEAFRKSRTGHWNLSQGHSFESGCESLYQGCHVYRRHRCNWWSGGICNAGDRFFKIWRNNRIRKISAAHLHRSWVTVPHVTQFDEANITELEAFRKSLAKEAEKKGVRLTPLVFMMKAVVASLKAFPDFNASLEASGERLILKKYFHIGVAVDTPNGLVVPVIRDVDQKGLYDLAAELAATAERAREGKLSPGDMQGGCFTISSLGGIGGTQFTPIVNAPEVAILGIARAKMQPVYAADGSFVPGLILPLALSYDHRVIDGAQGARFTSYLSQVITDIRRVLL
jgi:pyruvate dehydrogenase E2 component (dihydrolipoamide acetyltransferase)